MSLFIFGLNSLILYWDNMAKKDLQRIKAEGYLHVEDRNMDKIKPLSDDYEKLSRIYTLLKGYQYEIIIKDTELDEEYSLEDLFDGKNQDQVDYLFKDCLRIQVASQMQDNYNLIKKWAYNDKPDFDI
jgi:hypothetical protein